MIAFLDQARAAALILASKGVESIDGSYIFMCGSKGDVNQLDPPHTKAQWAAHDKAKAEGHRFVGFYPALRSAKQEAHER